jgi:BolA protein
VSQQFAGKPVQRRHRMVYEALGQMMKREIHALSIQAYAPEEI